MKASQHFTDEDLLQRLYGLVQEVQPDHLESCPECHARWLALSERRAAVVEIPAATPAIDSLLRAQRAAVRARIENRPQSVLRLLPVAATALLVVVSFALHQPSPRLETPEFAALTSPADSDEQLMKEIVSLVNEDAPRITVPIRGLFSEGRASEVQ